MSNTESKVESQLVELNKEEIYKEAIKTWGPQMQIIMCLEEMSELQKELIKHIRGKGKYDCIAEEIADVFIMLEQMVVLFDCNFRVASHKQFKLTRLKGLLGKENEEQT